MSIDWNLPFVSLIRLKNKIHMATTTEDPLPSNSGSAHSPYTLLNKHNHMVTNRKLVVQTLQTQEENMAFC